MASSAPCEALCRQQRWAPSARRAQYDEGMHRNPQEAETPSRQPAPPPVLMCALQETAVFRVRLAQRHRTTS